MTIALSLPNGTLFRARYKGRVVHAHVYDGSYVVGQRRFPNPQRMLCTLVSEICGKKTHVAALQYLEFKKPGEVEYKRMKRDGLFAKMSPEILEKIKHDYAAGRPIADIAAEHSLSYKRAYSILFTSGIHQPKWRGSNLNLVKCQQPAMPDIEQPTQAQKRAIRAALDTHFDADKGVFLSGKSDQELGRMLNVPWAAVARIREDFFGPLTEDVEVTVMREELRMMRHAITDCEENEEKLREKLTVLTRDATAFAEKLARIERRFTS